MPGKRDHKGGRRQFTNPQALENEKQKEEKQKAWRRARGEESSDSEDESGSGSGSDASSESGGSGVEFAAEGAAGGAKAKKPVKKKPAAAAKKGEESSSSEEESGSESESDSDDDRRGKGVEGLIEIANPNRAQPKTKKVSQINVNDKATLSRREREEIEAQRAKAHYQKLHAAGKTDEARADLARLAIIRKQREDAAKKREAERLGEWQKRLRLLANHP